jgi:hypothetical protein
MSLQDGLPDSLRPLRVAPRLWLKTHLLISDVATGLAIGPVIWVCDRVGNEVTCTAKHKGDAHCPCPKAGHKAPAYCSQ